MYARVVRGIIRWAFDRLGRQDTEALLARTDPGIVHTFGGDHALGGTRYSRDAFEKWLGRLFRLFPELKFELHEVLVAGPPWNTRVAVTWTDRGRTADGQAYVNEGVHVLRLRWGKVVALRAHLDTQHLEHVLQEMAANGIAEAAAEPITG